MSYWPGMSLVLNVRSKPLALESGPKFRFRFSYFLSLWSQACYLTFLSLFWGILHIELWELNEFVYIKCLQWCLAQTKFPLLLTTIQILSYFSTWLCSFWFVHKTSDKGLGKAWGLTLHSWPSQCDVPRCIWMFSEAVKRSSENCLCFRAPLY
jgi:hypothetical protein